MAVCIEPVIVPIGSNSALRVNGVSSPDTGAPIQGALVEATLIDEKTSQPIVGETWPVLLADVPGVPGNYSYVLSDQLVLEDMQLLQIQTYIDAGAQLKWRANTPAIAEVQAGL